MNNLCLLLLIVAHACLSSPFCISWGQKKQSFTLLWKHIFFYSVLAFWAKSCIITQAKEIVVDPVQSLYYQIRPVMLFFFCSLWIRYIVAFLRLFLFFIYIFVPLHRPECSQYFWFYTYSVWTSATRIHWINTHLAGAVMKGLVSNCKLLLGECNLCIHSNKMDNGNKFAC